MSITKRSIASFAIALFISASSATAAEKPTAATPADSEAVPAPEAKRDNRKRIRELDRRLQILLQESLYLQRDLLSIGERFGINEVRKDDAEITTYLNSAASFLAANGEDVAQLAVKDHRRLGDLYLAYGMHREAVNTYDKLITDGTSTPSAAWLALAERQYYRGYRGLTGEVEYALAHIPEQSNETIAGGKQLLQAQLYLEQKRFNDAEQLLDRWNGSDEREAFAHFNRAVALIRKGERKDGASILDKTGRIDAPTPTLLALRDKANLELGLFFLEDDQAGTAIPILQRIRLDGPYSNHALLALGWAELSERGTLQANPGAIAEECSDPLLDNLSGLAGIIRARSSGCEIIPRFQRASGSKNEDQAYRLALIPWQVLQQRPVWDPPVQEGLLAVSYAAEQREDWQEATDAYALAIEKLQAESRLLTKAIGAAKRGSIRKAIVKQPIKALNSDDPEIQPTDDIPLARLYPLLASHPFSEALQSYRDLLALKDVMNRWPSKLSILSSELRRQSAKFRSRRGAEGRSLLIQSNRNPRVRYLSNSSRRLAEPALKFSNDLALPAGKASDTATNELRDEAPSDEVASEGPLAKIKTNREKITLVSGHIGSGIAAYENFIDTMLQEELGSRLARINVYLARARLGNARLAERMAIEKAATETFSDAETTQPVTDGNESSADESQEAN